MEFLQWISPISSASFVLCLNIKKGSKRVYRMIRPSEKWLIEGLYGLYSWCSIKKHACGIYLHLLHIAIDDVWGRNCIRISKIEVEPAKWRYQQRPTRSIISYPLVNVYIVNWNITIGTGNMHYFCGHVQ